MVCFTNPQIPLQKPGFWNGRSKYLRNNRKEITIAEPVFFIGIIEQQDAQYQQAIDDDILAVSGDARREETLTEAGVKWADTVIGAIDNSNANIQISIAASQLAPTVTLVVRTGDQRDEALAQRAGADEVVIPEVVSGEHVCTTL